MFQASVKYKGFPAGAAGRIASGLHDVGTKLAHDVEAHAKANIVAVGAVDTGATLNSIAAREVGYLVWSIGPTTFYAIFIEHGTIYIGARPFLIPALEVVKQYIEPAVAALIKRELAA